MNALRDWLGDEWVYALGWSLIHSIWQIGLLAMVVALIMVSSRQAKPVYRYRLYLGAFFSIPFLTAGTLWTLYAEALRHSRPSPQFNLGVIDIPPPIDMVAREVVSPGAMEVLWNWLSMANLNLPFIVGIWLIGVGIFSLRFVGGLFAVNKLRRSASKNCPPEWEQSLSDLARQLGVKRIVRLAESALVTVPMTAGWLKPVILMPVGMIMGMSAAQVEMILLHELAHIRRHDYLVNLLQSVLEILFFYHPAMWWISDALRREREHCCDEKVVSLKGDPLTYAKALHLAATTARLRNAGSVKVVPQSGLAVTGPDGELLERIHRILNKEMKKTIYSTRFAASAVMVLGLSAFLLLLPTENNRPDKAVVVDTRTEVSVGNQITVLPPSEPLQGAVADTVPPRNREVVITRNVQGEVTELYINGKLIPKSDYDRYADVLKNYAKPPAPQMPSHPAPPPVPRGSWSGGSMPAPPPTPSIDSISIPAPMLPNVSVNIPPIPTPPMSSDSNGRDWEDFNRYMQNFAADLNRSLKQGFDADELERNVEEFERNVNRWASKTKVKVDSKEWREYEKAMDKWSRNLENRLEAYYESDEWRSYERAMEVWGDSLSRQMKSHFNTAEWREFKRSMEAWSESFAESIESRFGPEFENAMSNWGRQMEALGENFGRSMDVWSEQFAERMEVFSDRMEAFGEKMKAFGERMDAMKAEISVELVKDRLIRDRNEHYQLELKKDAMFLNGKKQSDSLARKYREIVRKYNIGDFTIKGLEYDISIDNDDRN